MGVFYTNNGIIGSQCPEWLQGELNLLIGLFCRIGHMENVANYKIMTCQPGAIWSEISEEVVGRRSTGKVDTYRERLWCRIPCPNCRVDLTEGLTTAHRRRLHGTDTAIDWGQLLVSQMDHLHQVF